jgi:hypothetical protein
MGLIQLLEASLGCRPRGAPRRAPVLYEVGAEAGLSSDRSTAWVVLSCFYKIEGRFKGFVSATRRRRKFSATEINKRQSWSVTQRKSIDRSRVVLHWF